MSRSRHPQCSVGRGCGVCGDAGEVARDREDEAAAVDAVELLDAEPPEDWCEATDCPCLRQEIGIPTKEEFRVVVAVFLLISGNDRKLAAHVKCAISTTHRYVSGTACPHSYLRRAIVQWIGEQS